MILGAKRTLTDRVLESILQGNATALDIQNNLEVSASIQGIYKALRELISENIILKQGKKYFINNKWHNEVKRLISKKDVFVLQPGEEIRYKFKKIQNTDAFWKNMFVDISATTGHYPVFSFLPHQFWILLKERGQSELEYHQELDSKKIHSYTLIGGETEFDRLAKNKLTSTYHELHLDNKTSFTNRDYLVILNDYIIITRIPSQAANSLDDLYQQAKTEKELADGLEKIFSKATNITIIVKRDKTKAQKIRKTISKDFYIPKELKEKFDLFSFYK